ncbi:four-carbon acid sugar kinase family protein [Microbacterium proteolyticum]|uniref:four-carbon acid sugar kinase family protein n=1 Tax=Microbacterium proteolyticum TaxID=1572644 RepID=UPI002416EE9E|nr:four-carbon acid sugar kinase family protein [Microbacterium proteolyticum]
MASIDPAALPAVAEPDVDALAARVADADRVFVVLDDDPTGTQSVADLPVLGAWDVEDFAWAFASGAPAVYVLTNSRSLAPESAERINREVVRAALRAAERSGIRVDFVSRSDSTLRGHFPLEPDTIIDEVRRAGGTHIGNTVVVPAFPDAGRITIDGTHGVLADGAFTPIGETEFARDSTFGFTASRLADWVEEKSGGEIAASDVVQITLATLRRSAAAVADALRSAADGVPIVVDAVVEEDLIQLALGLEIVEAEGRSFVYRVGPPFVRARIGQRLREPVDVDGLTADRSVRGGLIVVGSHVGLTSRQLAHLVDHRDLAVVELEVPRLLEAHTAADEVTRVIDAVSTALLGGDVVIHTSRTLVRTDDPAESLDISRRVSQAVVDIVHAVAERRTPRFVIAKGGITSSDVATRGLDIRRARVRGSLFPGIVSVWEAADGLAAGIPYIVFAGNVGDDTSLTAAVARLSATA